MNDAKVEVRTRWHGLVGQHVRVIEALDVGPVLLKGSGLRRGAVKGDVAAKVGRADLVDIGVLAPDDPTVRQRDAQRRQAVLPTRNLTTVAAPSPTAPSDRNEGGRAERRAVPNATGHRKAPPRPEGSQRGD